jgi:hypothetical protein
VNYENLLFKYDNFKIKKTLHFGTFFPQKSFVSSPPDFFHSQGTKIGLKGVKHCLSRSYVPLETDLLEALTSSQIPEYHNTA